MSWSLMEVEIHKLEVTAYNAVLTAFQAQADGLSWEKEGLITDLRSELNISNDTHAVLLEEIRADELIGRIRKWRETHDVPQLPTTQGIRKRVHQFQIYEIRKQLVSGDLYSKPSFKSFPPLSLPGPSIQQTSTSSLKRGRIPDDSEPIQTDSPIDDDSLHKLIGRRLMIRDPPDMNFVDAVITDYNHIDGSHLLLFNGNTPNVTARSVKIRHVPEEDIRWISEDTAVPMHKYPMTIVFPDYEEITMRNTDVLLDKVQKLLDTDPQDLLEIKKAKMVMKEHELELMEVINKLASYRATTDGDNEQPQPPNADKNQGPSRNPVEGNSSLAS